MANITKNRFMSPTRPIIGKDLGISVVILASSAGPRMKTHGPQPLIKDKNGISLLDHQAAIFKTEFPNSELVIVGGFEVDKIARNKPNYVRLVENQHYNESGEIEDIRLALNNILYENVLIVFGDIYFGASAIRGIKNSCLSVEKHGKMLEEDVGVTIVENRVTIMSLSLKEIKWSKIAYFTDKEYKLLKQFVSNRENGKLFMWEGINYILENQGTFGAKMIGPNETLVHVDSSAMLDKI